MQDYSGVPLEVRDDYYHYVRCPTCGSETDVLHAFDAESRTWGNITWNSKGPPSGPLYKCWNCAGDRLILRWEEVDPPVLEALILWKRTRSTSRASSGCCSR
jgi:hypothetical protein